MSMEAALKTTKPEEISELEARMLTLDQVECPVSHHFGPGIYIREAVLPAGSIVLGHHHRFPTLNILVSGSVMFYKDGNSVTLTAPHVFTSPPGRKLAYVVEEAVWHNVHATMETDLKKLELMLIDKTDVWKSHHDEIAALTAALAGTDVDV